MADIWEYKFVTINVGDKDSTEDVLNGHGRSNWQVFHIFGDKKNTTYVMKRPRVINIVDARVSPPSSRRNGPYPWTSGRRVIHKVDGPDWFEGDLAPCGGVLTRSNAAYYWTGVTCENCLASRVRPERVIHKVDTTEEFDGALASCGAYVSYDSPWSYHWDAVTCRRCLGARPVKVIHKVSPYALHGEPTSCGLVFDSNNQNVSAAWSSVTCLRCLRTRPEDEARRPSWKLTHLEEDLYGRIAANFAPGQKVYSRADVENILRGRER